MTRAISDKPDIIVGEVRSSKAFVAAGLAESAKILYITPMATAPQVTKNKKYVFRTCINDDFQGAHLAEFAIAELKAKNATIIWDSSQLYSKALAESFRDEFKRLGGRILSNHKLHTKLSNLEPIVADVKSQQPDIVFMPVYEDLGLSFVKGVRSSGLKGVKILGGDGWNSLLNFKS